jgi:hypothetical protein
MAAQKKKQNRQPHGATQGNVELLGYSGSSFPVRLARLFEQVSSRFLALMPGRCRIIGHEFSSRNPTADGRSTDDVLARTKPSSSAVALDPC